ncbi:MAG: hypothetical protein AAGC74_03525 [Verrucomicrobiota bacterium]
MKSSLHPPHRKRGFTLLEMTTVILFSMSLSTIGLGLLNQQIQIQSLLQRQEFILEDAPRINHAITSILSRADAIRLHSSYSDAINDTSAVTTNASTLVAAFRDADGDTTFGLIVFETIAGETQLNYYYFDPAGTAPAAGDPNWNISRNVTATSFDLIDGVFTTSLTGPNAETISYSSSPNQ